MATVEQYVISYEDRDEVHTSRWKLMGLNTKAAGNTYGGWLFLVATKSGDDATFSLYKDPACASAYKVAEGTADVSGVDDAPVKVTLAEANSSGLAGSVYVEDYDSDPSDIIPILVTLCVDTDLIEEWYDIDSLPSEVYDETYGMASHCVAASRKALLLVSQMYAEELGGYGGREHMHYLDATRASPDWRRLIVPDQMKDAAACWALELAFGACHKLAADTMYSALRDRFEQRRKDAIAAWNLTFNVDPDSDQDADSMKSGNAVRLTRI